MIRCVGRARKGLFYCHKHNNYACLPTDDDNKTYWDMKHGILSIQSINLSSYTDDRCFSIQETPRIVVPTISLIGNKI